MARANNIPVRLIVGQGYGEGSYGNHAWNQAYISSLGGWINIDTTFASDFFKNEKEVNAPYDPSGVLTNYPQIFDTGNEQIEIPAVNFFGNKDFNKTHRNAQIIGQWN